MNISIITPVFNEEKNLPRFLKWILEEYNEKEVRKNAILLLQKNGFLEKEILKKHKELLNVVFKK